MSRFFWEDAWLMRTPRECWLTLAWWVNLEALPDYGVVHLAALCGIAEGENA